MNSSLVEYSHLPPNNSDRRNHEVDRITPHCVVGQISGESLGSWFAQTSTQASSNYGIDKDGRVCQYVDEANRAWTSSSAENDNRAVTIECASDTYSPFAFKDVVYKRLIDLCVDICKRYNKNVLLWIPDRDEALNRQLKPREMLLTVHRWFSNTACPGDWLMARMADLAAQVTKRLGGQTTSQPKQQTANSTPESFIASISDACIESMKETGILASVSIAQACLETGYGQSELAQKANNLFGMKCLISGNTWAGSTWEGIPYRKKTSEYDSSTGQSYEIYALFRKYDNVRLSIEDHGAYLANARNGNKLRYAGIIGETDPAKVCDILRTGGYATGPDYKDSLLSIIDRYNLTQYDAVKPEPAEPDRVKIPKTFEQVQIGDECQSVWVLRTMLRGRDYKTAAGKRISRSKRFDTDCDYAVRAFQKKQKLVEDGIVGEKTWKKLMGV